MLHKEISLEVDPGYSPIDFNLYYKKNEIKIFISLRTSSNIYNKAKDVIGTYLLSMHSRTFLKRQNIIIK